MEVDMARKTTNYKRLRMHLRALAVLAVVLGAGLIAAVPARAEHRGDVGVHFFFGLPVPFFPVPVPVPVPVYGPPVYYEPPEYYEGPPVYYGPRAHYYERPYYPERHWRYHHWRGREAHGEWHDRGRHHGHDRD
jgi:hypothetical protein